MFVAGHPARPEELLGELLAFFLLLAEVFGDLGADLGVLEVPGYWLRLLPGAKVTGHHFARRLIFGNGRAATDLRMGSLSAAGSIIRAFTNRNTA